MDFADRLEVVLTVVDARLVENQTVDILRASGGFGRRPSQIVLTGDEELEARGFRPSVRLRENRLVLNLQKGGFTVLIR